MPDQDFAILPNRAEWSLFYFEHRYLSTCGDFHALIVADIPLSGTRCREQNLNDGVTLEQNKQ